MIHTIDPTEQEQRNWAMGAHLSSLVAVAGLPFGHIIGPLVVYLASGEKRPFATEHAKAALNYQITLSIGILILLFFGIFAYVGAIAGAAASKPESPFVIGAFIGLIGCFLLFAVGAIWSLVLIIMGAVAAGQGRPYRYPFAINFVK